MFLGPLLMNLKNIPPNKVQSYQCLERQDEEGSLFQTEIPDLAAGDDAVLASTLPSSGSSGPGQGNAPAVAVGSTSAVMSFK